MFSLVIPTFNRAFYFERLLSYYSDLHFEHSIVVADSSSGSSLETNREVVEATQKNLNVSHQIYPADTPPYAKLVRTLCSLRSPYVAVCADDDFIIPSGLAKCVEFLDANPGYSIAHGYTTAVLVVRGDSEREQIKDASSYPQRGIELETAADRLVDHLSHYTATYYSVHRRAQLAVSLQRASDRTVDYRFGELLSSCLSLIRGKARRLDVLYMVRQADLEPPKYAEKMMPWHELLVVEDFPKRYAEFRDCLADELMHASTLSVEEANAVVDRGFASYLAENVTSNNDHGQRPLDRALRAIRSLPLAVRAAILDGEFLGMIRDPRQSYRRVAAMQDKMSLPSLLNARSPFHSDFMHVYRHLLMTSSREKTVHGDC